MAPRRLNPKAAGLRLDHESTPHKLRRRKRYVQRERTNNDSVAGLGDAGAGRLPARVGRRRVLLLFGEERRHPAAGSKSLHHLGSPGANRNLYRAAEVRGQRARFRHGDPDAEPAEAARDAARLLQAPRGVLDPEEARVSALEAAALRSRPEV